VEKRNQTANRERWEEGGTEGKGGKRKVLNTFVYMGVVGEERWCMVSMMQRNTTAFPRHYESKMGNFTTIEKVLIL
jgi:hypothetical protein